MKVLKTLKVISIYLTVISLMTACGGSDSNRVNTDNNSTVFTNNLPNLNGTQQTSVATVASSYPCTQGPRLTQTATFSVSGAQQSGSLTTIGGGFQAGALGGTASRVYVGVSVWNDLLIVSKIANGAQVIGYNVTLSMCSFVVNGIPYIANERQLTNFQAPSGIVLDEDVSCAHGSVDAAINTYVQSAAYSYTQNGFPIQLPPFDVWTTFFKPGCNGSFN